MNKVLTTFAVLAFSLGFGGCASMMSLSADMARVGARAASGSADVLDKHAKKREVKDAQEAAADKSAKEQAPAVAPKAAQPAADKPAAPAKPAKKPVTATKKPTPAAKPMEG